MLLDVAVEVGKSRHARKRIRTRGGRIAGTVRTPILDSPANVRSVLATLPSVAPLIPDPADEGDESDAFPGVLRKTRKELYRWIANTHYPHLAKVVPVLDRVHAAGCTFGNLLTTFEP